VDRAPLEIDGGPVQLQRRGGQLQLSGDHFSATVDWASKRAEIRLPLNLTPLDLLLKIIYARLLLREQACFVHGCAVEREGRGYLFFGQSGSGKSTLARSAGATVLADELVIVKREQSSYSIHGTPFWGGLNRRAPLTGLFALRFHPETASLTPLPPAGTLRRLLPCLGGFGATGGDETRLFDWAAALVTHHACHDLCRSPRSGPWEWLHAAAA
jgi:hypothetical protein